VLSRGGKRIEHYFERLCGSHTNESRLRPAVRTDRRDYGEFVPSHVLQYFRFAERFHGPTLTSSKAAALNTLNIFDVSVAPVDGRLGKRSQKQKSGPPPADRELGNLQRNSSDCDFTA
jgi:hypothetical protein